MGWGGGGRALDFPSSSSCPEADPEQRHVALAPLHVLAPRRQALSLNLPGRTRVQALLLGLPHPKGLVGTWVRAMDKKGHGEFYVRGILTLCGSTSL